MIVTDPPECDVARVNFLRQLLTYRSEPTAVSFIQILFESARDNGSTAEIDSISACFRSSPQLQAVIAEEVGKFEYCAHPAVPSPTTYVVD